MEKSYTICNISVKSYPEICQEVRSILKSYGLRNPGHLIILGGDSSNINLSINNEHAEQLKETVASLTRQVKEKYSSKDLEIILKIGEEGSKIDLSTISAVHDEEEESSKLNLSSAAYEIGMKAWDLAKLVKQKKIPYSIDGNKIYFKKDDLAQLLEEKVEEILEVKEKEPEKKDEPPTIIEPTDDEVKEIEVEEQLKEKIRKEDLKPKYIKTETKELPKRSIEDKYNFDKKRNKKIHQDITRLWSNKLIVPDTHILYHLAKGILKSLCYKCLKEPQKYEKIKNEVLQENTEITPEKRIGMLFGLVNDYDKGIPQYNNAYPRVLLSSILGHFLKQVKEGSSIALIDIVYNEFCHLMDPANKRKMVEWKEVPIDVARRIVNKERINWGNLKKQFEQKYRLKQRFEPFWDELYDNVHKQYWNELKPEFRQEYGQMFESVKKLLLTIWNTPSINAHYLGQDFSNEKEIPEIVQQYNSYVRDDNYFNNYLTRIIIDFEKKPSYEQALDYFTAIGFNIICRNKVRRYIETSSINDVLIFSTALDIAYNGHEIEFLSNDYDILDGRNSLELKENMNGKIKNGNGLLYDTIKYLENKSDGTKQIRERLREKIHLITGNKIEQIEYHDLDEQDGLKSRWVHEIVF